jgi:hypothetical protein
MFSMIALRQYKFLKCFVDHKKQRKRKEWKASFGTFL